MNFDKNLHYTSIVRIAYTKSHVEGKELVLHKSNKIKMKNNKKLGIFIEWFSEKV